MQDINKKFKHYLISSIILFVVILGIIIISTFSFGWFFIDNSVGVSFSMHIQEQNIAALPFKAYIYNEETNIVDVFSNQEKTYLPAYDTVFTEKNTNSLIIYQVRVFGTKINEEEPFTITLSLNDNIESNSFSSNLLSNVIQVKCAVINSLQEVENLEEDYIYNTAKNYFKESENLQRETFVKIINDKHSKSNNIIFTINNYSIQNDNSLVFYLEFSYDPILIAEWLEINNMTITSDIVGNNIVEIESDLNCFTFN